MVPTNGPNEWYQRVQCGTYHFFRVQLAHGPLAPPLLCFAVVVRDPPQFVKGHKHFFGSDQGLKIRQWPPQSIFFAVEIFRFLRQRGLFLPQAIDLFFDLANVFDGAGCFVLEYC